jgi:hypothetical protein
VEKNHAAPHCAIESDSHRENRLGTSAACEGAEEMDWQLKEDSTHPGYYMRKLIRSHWPLIVAIGVFVGTIAIALTAELRQTEGHLVYALDDAYIHMAMAKNLAQHGIYGVTEYEFSSSSSSPLWTLSLAFATSVFGVHEVLPFLWNLLLALAILVVLHALLRRAAVGPVTIAVALLAIIYATPMSAMVFSGMEHLFHILLTIIFLWIFARIITTERNSSPSAECILFFALAVALVLVRYESYALLVITDIFFLLRRRWKMAAGLCLAGILPLVAYQVISVAHGWSWLPNSVLIRTGMSNAGAETGSGPSVALSSGISRVYGMLSNFISNLDAGLHLVALIVVSGTLLLISMNRTSSFWTLRKVMVTVFILAALAHLMFGHIGQFFRYEAYLIATGLFASTCIIPEVTPISMPELTGGWKRTMLMWVIGISFALALIPLTIRSKDSLALTPVASRNIFEQQYQMGMFLQRYYPRESVAVNDIGTVSFLTHVHLMDLVGLASIDVLQLKRSGEYDTGHIQALCQKHGVRVAIVYDSWLQRIATRGRPLPWTKVGEWRIFGNVVCSDDVVSFYAVQPSEKERLVLNLRSFSSVLPAHVTQTGSYMENDSSIVQ